jgi:putative membrane protein
MGRTRRAAAPFVVDRMALGRPRGKGVGGALAQGVPPLIVLVAAATPL